MARIDRINFEAALVIVSPIRNFISQRKSQNTLIAGGHHDASGADGHTGGTASVGQRNRADDAR
jgi:hypothetical protein